MSNINWEQSDCHITNKVYITMEDRMARIIIHVKEHPLWGHVLIIDEQETTEMVVMLIGHALNAVGLVHAVTELKGIPLPTDLSSAVLNNAPCNWYVMTDEYLKQNNLPYGSYNESCIVTAYRNIIYPNSHESPEHPNPMKVYREHCRRLVSKPTEANPTLELLVGSPLIDAGEVMCNIINHVLACTWIDLGLSAENHEYIESSSVRYITKGSDTYTAGYITMVDGGIVGTGTPS